MHRNDMIPFNWPYMTGKELYNIAECHFKGQLAGDGVFTKRCHAWLEQSIGCRRALLTNSCTAALEMSALLLNIQPGDEVIVPSYTFVSTANAFVLRGAIPVFVDVRSDTLNIDESQIEAAITDRTRAIVVVHYAGVGCEMDTIREIADRHGLPVIEDAAQAIMATYKGRALGSLGQFSAFSFHETKNIMSGEGGCLGINDPAFTDRAEILREKGTNRAQFFRGEADKYTWHDVGSSFLPGELIAAFLWAQFQEAEQITARRISSWNHYHQCLEPLEASGKLRRPEVPAHCRHNAHIYHVILEASCDRHLVLERLRNNGVSAHFHYVPLHSSPAGLRFGRTSGPMTNTESAGSRLIRLPMWVGLTESQIEYAVDQLAKSLQ